MVAVPEMCMAAPVTGADAAQLAVLTQCRRVVAIAGTAMELLRPESDLLRIIASTAHVDLLVASVDEPVGTSGRLGVLGELTSAGSAVDSALRASQDESVVESDDGDYDYGDYDDADDHRSQLRAEVAALGLPGLHVHHLDLRTPIDADVEPDLVAALSELVGFDPEPGVYCVAPDPGSGDVARAALAAAAQRIAQIYGLPLRRYRSLELAVVPEQRGLASI